MLPNHLQQNKSSSETVQASEAIPLSEWHNFYHGKQIASRSSIQIMIYSTSEDWHGVNIIWAWVRVMINSISGDNIVNNILEIVTKNLLVNLLRKQSCTKRIRSAFTRSPDSRKILFQTLTTQTRMRVRKMSQKVRVPKIVRKRRRSRTRAN